MAQNGSTTHTHLHVAEGLLAFESPSIVAQSRSVITALPQRAPVEPRDHQEPLGVLSRSQEPHNVLVSDSVHTPHSRRGDTPNITTILREKKPRTSAKKFAFPVSRGIGGGEVFLGT